MKSPIILRIFKENQLSGVKQFDQEQIVVGRNVDVHLNLDFDGVAPIHCLLEQRDSGWYVCDLGSETGTFKNGQAVLDEQLQSGDEINLGPCKIIFFVGVPKPQAIPVPGSAETKSPAATPVVAPPPIVSQEMPPAAVVKTETVGPEVKVETKQEPQETVIVKKEESLKPAAVKKEAVPVSTEKVAIPSDIPAVVEFSEEKVVTPVGNNSQIVKENKEKKAVPSAEVRKPEIKAAASAAVISKSKKGTYAPLSAHTDLRKELKLTSGPMVEVIVAWKERILTTHHFSGKKVVRVNGKDDNSIALPEGMLPAGFPLIQMGSGIVVNLNSALKVELVNSAGIVCGEQLDRLGKIVGSVTGQAIKLDQNEMVCLNLPGGNLYLYIKCAPATTKAPLLPLMTSGSEMMSFLGAMIAVGLLALYVTTTTPKDFGQEKQEDVQRIAQVVFNNPPPKPPAPPPPPPEPPKVEVPPPPKPPEPKKVKVADKAKAEQTKAPQNKPAPKQQVAARASDVAPKPNSQNKPKEFKSTNQGGAVKTGQSEGANATSKNKDVSKLGLMSAFGGGGSRSSIDKAYSGAGEVLGMADKATGTSGFNQDRAGDDLGSKFKDSGAGGKGTATQGIAGIGTKGRGTGQSAYGAADGYGSKTSVAIEPGGMEEAFDPTIDKEAIRRVIRSNISEVRSCYERVLNTKPKGTKLEGKVVLGWDIIERGQARNVKVVSSTLGNKEIEDCIKRRLASWTFPEPPTGMAAEVQAYPFVLNQSN